ncbi:MAG: helix-turn-helix transcriptional regulator, partial [Clostridia bacterium]|nr:helix-turn-helix transcriptional regulator [Clostridia bacterium]
MKTLGQNIATFRKDKNITQEALAEICGVSSQAVSKWENDISCPDIALLKTIARTFGVSVDELMDDGEGPVTRLAESKDMSNKFLRIKVLSADGDKVNVNLPLALIELFLSNEGI